MAARLSVCAGLCARKDFVLAAPKCPLSKYFARASCRLPVVVLSFKGDGRGAASHGVATFCRRSRGAGSKGVSAPRVDAAFASPPTALHSRGT